MVFQILLICFRLFRVTVPHQPESVTSAVSLYYFATFVNGRCASVSGNTRCNLFRTNVFSDFTCRQDTRLIISFFWLRLINEVQRIAHTLDMARLQPVRINHCCTAAYKDIIAEFYGYILAMQCLYRFLSVNLMTVHASVTSCPCILRLVVHHVRHSVQGFTLDAFRFLTFRT